MHRYFKWISCSISTTCSQPARSYLRTNRQAQVRGALHRHILDHKQWETIAFSYWIFQLIHSIQQKGKSTRFSIVLNSLVLPDFSRFRGLFFWKFGPWIIRAFLLHVYSIIFYSFQHLYWPRLCDVTGYGHGIQHGSVTIQTRLGFIPEPVHPESQSVHPRAIPGDRGSGGTGEHGSLVGGFRGSGEILIPISACVGLESNL